MNYLLAKEHILSKLEKDLSPNLYYHGIHHTIDVFKAVERFATVEGVKGNDLTILKTAALYHDAGFIIQYMEHEAASVVIAKEFAKDIKTHGLDVALVAELPTYDKIILNLEWL